MLLQLEFTAWPGQPRSRFTPQNASRARWFWAAKSRIWVHVVGEVSSDWSLRPFMPEMPLWANAVAWDQPNALRSEVFRPLVALTVALNMLFPAPKSNGMMVNMSMFAWVEAARLTSWVPAKLRPLW